MKFTILVVAILFLSACGTTSEIGSEKIVETSKSDSDWINTPTSDDGEFLFITGELTKANDRSFGMNQAYADGLRKLMNAMQNDVKTQSSLALRGANLESDDIGRFSEFAVGWISDTYKIAGVQNPETYWEKVETKTASGVKYYYNCYSLLKISKVDFNKALEGAYDNMRKKARELNNIKAEETATNLINQLNENNK